MANYNPPLENLPIFDNSVFVSPDTALTIDYANKHYLKFPTAQGTENLLAINVAGLASMLSGIDIADGTNKTNIDQSGANITIDNNVNNGTLIYKANNGSGVETTILSANSTNASLTTTGTTTLTSANLTLTTTNPPTCSATQPASSDSSTKIPTTAWVQSAIAGGATSPILSSVGYYPYYNKTIGTWQTFNTTTGTQFVDIYTIGGGGFSGSDATDPTLGWSKGIGGCGGGGGMVLNSRVSLGGYSNAIAELNQPQFVCGTTNTSGNPTNLNYTSVWSGTFTQNGTTITITSTTSGAMAIGAVLTFTKSAFDTAYPASTTPYGAYYNQLIVWSGSGSTWQVVNTSSQTLSTAISGTAYNPTVIWEGTFSQSGFEITPVSTTSGSFSFNSSVTYYLTCNSTANNIQAITGVSATTPGNLTVNTSMTLGATGARILRVDAGNNVMTRFWSYGAGMNNAYPYFPYIAWCEGGFKGTNGYEVSLTMYGGQGGYGGTCINYLPAGAQTSNGARGQNGGTNTDPSGFTKVSGQGGYSYLTNGKDSMTINGVVTSGNIYTSPQLYQYNQGGSTYSPSAFAVNHYPAGQGGCVLVCYKY